MILPPNIFKNTWRSTPLTVRSSWFMVWRIFSEVPIFLDPLMDNGRIYSFRSVLKSKFIHKWTPEDGHYRENPSNRKLLTVRGVDCRVFLKMFGGKITLYCTLNVLHNFLCPSYTQLLDIVVIHCCTSCCGAVWLMLWSCSSSVQGHYPVSYAGPRSRWSLNIHTLMKDVSAISTSDEV